MAANARENTEIRRQNYMKKLFFSLALVLQSSVGCADSGDVDVSGSGLDFASAVPANPSHVGSDTPSISAAPASTADAVCGDFPLMQGECVWHVCSDSACLGLQMCWRMNGPFPQCVFWDYPDPDLCCPDTAGQVVAP